MVKPIVNMYEAEPRAWKKGSKFEARLTRLGGLIGAEQLGAQLIVLPRGKAAYPRHAHHNNEELFVVLEGSGEYQAGSDTFAVKAGDVISAVAGDGSTAHQMRNNSSAELKYLAVSTRHDPDVVEYPDSGKFAVASRVPRGSGLLGAALAYVGRKNSGVDYWDGEDIGESE